MNKPFNIYTDKPTEQQLADHIINHLLTQNEKSHVERGPQPGCKYRGPRGLQCAAGCCFTGDEVARIGEGVTVHPLTIPPRFMCVAVLLRLFQRIHDTVDVIDWREALQKVCTDYNLQYNPPTPPTTPAAS